MNEESTEESPIQVFMDYISNSKNLFLDSNGQVEQRFLEENIFFESTYELFRQESSLENKKLLLKKVEPFLEKRKSRFEHKTSSFNQNENQFDSLFLEQIMCEPNLRTIIGDCNEILQLKKKLLLVAENECKVLFCGESGTGKTMLARVLHKMSLRKKEKYICVNIGAMQKDLIESSLFGTVKGAYTDALDKKGLFHMAEHGTIFLDEIGEMPLNCQVKLLHALEDGTFRKVGSTEDEKTDARFVFATNANLKELVKKKLFREDLYWRIAEFTIEVPPLRERGDDIIKLADFFLAEINKKNKNSNYSFSEKAKEKLKNHSWPGNIRELKSCINISTIFSQTPQIEEDSIQIERSY